VNHHYKIFIELVILFEYLFNQVTKNLFHLLSNVGFEIFRDIRQETNYMPMILKSAFDLYNN
jgi:hypothetical protein